MALGPSEDESMLKWKSIPFMLKRLTIQTDYGWTIYDNTTLIHKRKLSPQIGQDLDSDNQLPYCFARASNLGRTRENQICFQTNQIRSLTPAEPASGFSMTTTSNQSIQGRTLFPTLKLSHSPACLGVSARHKSWWLTPLLQQALNKNPLFPFGWSSFIPTCSKAECWNVHCLSFRSLGFGN